MTIFYMPVAVKAYRTRAGIVCTDAFCCGFYADLRFVPLSSADLDEEVNNRDGRPVKCACCLEILS
jgi:hypothetical protein